MKKLLLATIITVLLACQAYAGAILDDIYYEIDRKGYKPEIAAYLKDYFYKVDAYLMMIPDDENCSRCKASEKIYHAQPYWEIKETLMLYWPYCGDCAPKTVILDNGKIEIHRRGKVSKN